MAQLTTWFESKPGEGKQKIGNGPFGEVWWYRFADIGCQNYDEVAIKILPVKEDHLESLWQKFRGLFPQLEEVEGVCSLNSFGIINQKIYIIMKYYNNGSIGGRMAQSTGGKLSMSDALRYAVDLAQGILRLHSKGILFLNLKPFNFLLTENDRAILGDIGIPYLLLGIPLPESGMTCRLGTPNYMAPEQWQPEVRGPISFETDSWGFACSIVEMLTGVQPWCGKSIDEIQDAVVKRKETPRIPSGLPPPVENILHGCFEYDFRRRPLITDMLRVFKSVQNAVHNEGGWTGLGSIVPTDKPNGGYTEWFLSKADLTIGDVVRSRKPPNSSKPENMDVPEGKVMCLDGNTSQDGFVLVKVHGIHDPLRIHVSSLERVTLDLAAGDWVRLKEEDKRHSPVGILHSIHRDGSVEVGFIGLETHWKGKSSELQISETYYVGQFVRLKANVVSPRFEWPRSVGGPWATGKICWVYPNGCLLVKFPGRLTSGDSFMADPAEVELVTFNTCPGIVKKYQHLEDFHWVVRPLVIVFSLFTAMKIRFVVGKKVVGSKEKKRGGVLTFS